MADPTGESTGAALKLDFDRRLRLRVRGSVITPDRVSSGEFRFMLVHEASAFKPVRL